jgi:hypothetical protein
MFKGSRAFIAVLVVCACAVSAAPASAATTIGVAPDTSVHGPFQAQCYWGSVIETFGQTITVPVGEDDVLDRFSFYLVQNQNALSGSPLGPQTVTYKAYVYEWDAANNRAMGSAVWQSENPQVVTTSTSVQEVVAETGGVQLQSGAQYVIFLSISETSGNTADAGACFMHGSTFGGYSDGSAEWVGVGADESTWTTQAWSVTGSQDFAFSATFSSPAPPPPTTVYTFDGFYAPLNNKDAQGNYILNRVNAGAAIPVKFSLGGDYGLDVFEAGHPKSEVIACDSQAEVDGVEQTVNAGSSSLSYDAGTGTYNYVWKTDKAWQDTCRQLVVTFNDGQTARANFTFH